MGQKIKLQTLFSSSPNTDEFYTFYIWILYFTFILHLDFIFHKVV